MKEEVLDLDLEVVNTDEADSPEPEPEIQNEEQAEAQDELSAEGQPGDAPEVRISKRLQIKRDIRKSRKKKNFVRINLLSRQPKSPTLKTKKDKLGFEPPRVERTGRKRAIDQSVEEAQKFNSGRKRKIFDYESALLELREIQAKKKQEGPESSTSGTKATTSGASKTQTSTQVSGTRGNRWPSNHREKESGTQTDLIGGAGNHFSIMRNNVDLKWENERLMKENATLKARVNIILDLLVQKTSELKLLKMACLEKTATKTTSSKDL